MSYPRAFKFNTEHSERFLMSKTKKVWRCCPVQNSIEEVEVYADTPLDEWVSWYSSECYIYTNDYGSALYYMISSLLGKKCALERKIREWEEKKQKMMAGF